jgi:hypothetical protein
MGKIAGPNEAPAQPGPGGQICPPKDVLNAALEEAPEEVLVIGRRAGAVTVWCSHDSDTANELIVDGEAEVERLAQADEGEDEEDEGDVEGDESKA